MLSNSSARRKPKDAFPTSLASSASSSIVVTVKTVVKPAPQRPPPQPVLVQAPATTSTPSSSTKRVTPKRKRVSSPPPKQRVHVKKVKSTPPKSASPLPRSARSSQPRPPSRGFGALEKPIPRSCSISEDGNVPRVSSEDIIVKVLNEPKARKGYRAFFVNPEDPNDASFQPHPTHPPVVELEYPNHKASERFALLYPKDPDDYQPVRELIKVINTIVEFYLTPAQRVPFGVMNTFASLDPSRTSTPTLNSGDSTPVPETVTPLRRLEKAHNTRNGPAFIAAVNEISNMFRALKNEMMQNVKDLFEDPTTGGVPVRVWKTITEEVYQRSIGPDIEETKKYRSFSSQTYGELNPSFVSDIIHRLDLKPGKTFVDLGCGVGNCVVQAALQAGCDSYGIELNPPVAALGFKQEAEFKARLRMWGLSAGPVELIKGDFCEAKEVPQWLGKADVVLVNNYIFSSDLNEALSWKFLDLPEGAKVVVLKPFWPIGRPLTERTADTPEAVMTKIERIEYVRDSVSWTQEAGEFYIYTKSHSRHPLSYETTPGSSSTRASRSRAR